MVQKPTTGGGSWGTRPPFETVTPDSLEYFRPEDVIDLVLPRLSKREIEVLRSLPATFELSDVPYVTQEAQHYGGAAVVQMLAEWFGCESIPSQADIADGAGWESVDDIYQSSFSEHLAKYLVEEFGVLSAAYSVAGHFSPAIGDGLVAMDFIRENTEAIATRSFEYFKLQLFATRTPLVVRRHFSEEIYPMEEAVAERIDLAGQPVLLVGWDETGFLTHDPWDVDRWGGSSGGAYSHVEYDLLRDGYTFVNGSLCKDLNTAQLAVRLRPIQTATYPDRTVPIEVVVGWPGLPSLYAEYGRLSGFTVSLETHGDLTVAEPSMEFDAVELLPGQEVVFTGELDTGSREGSFPVTITVESTFESPSFLHTRDDVTPYSAPVTRTTTSRVYVYEKEYLANYGLTE
jgi:hypothetical protein